jgi:hypothetical protein
MDELRTRLDALESQLQALQQQTYAMARQLRWWRRLAGGLLVLGCLGWTLQAVTAGDGQILSIPERFAALEHKLTPLTFDAATREVRITGANLRLLNGLGATETTNGMGNLLVGYPEPRADGESRQPGSHNVVVGTQHQFSSFGGLVVGLQNEIRGAFASVSGGRGNTASGMSSSVSGGHNRTAEGEFDWVAGPLFQDE